MLFNPPDIGLGWPAPAKLNLFLHITGRRSDGYHELQSVFQFLDYSDELQFTLRDDGAIRRESELAGVAPDQDLVVRAARLLQQDIGTARGAGIHLQKRLPMGGGLGGGSSDAATTLVALNLLWECGLDDDVLAALGLQLGADVPVFIRGQAAWAEGVGERLEPVSLPEPWFVVLVPPVHVSTAEVFSHPQLIRDCPPIRIRDFLAGEGDNVCEDIVRGLYPQVDAALTALSGFGAARMTGTGACVFAPFTERAEADEALAALSDRWAGFVARACNRSPLLDRRDQVLAQLHSG